MSDRSDERWKRLPELLEDALALAPSERDGFLDRACEGDDALRQELASLVVAHDRSGSFDRIEAALAPVVSRVREAGAPLVGETVGRYRVIEPVGGGGMGLVYKAMDEALGRPVALKFLQSHLVADASATARFRQEARVVAALEHPNICTVHEIGETSDGRMYLAMPLYEGETLEEIIARGPLPVAEAVSIATQVARGLAKAHARGILHRDVKPSNVLVTSDGVVKVLDFGIAKLGDVTLTGGAGPIGTAAYMSPEQALGESLDARTDVWSLGVVLYEMLAATRPFARGVVGDAFRGHALEAPPLASHRTDVPPELDRLVRSALAWRREDRVESAQAFEDALLATGLAGRVGAPAARRSATGAARRVRLALAVGALALVGAVGIAWAVRRDEAKAPPAAAASEASIAVLPFVDRSQARDQAYFSDGMTDELIAALARVGGIRVASRTSAFAYKGRDVDVRTVASELGVATVLESSVRRDGNRLRVTSQLVNAADGSVVWSDSFDRDAGDAFAVQQEIASAIAQILRGQLVGGPAREDARDAPSAEAYDLYLKGRDVFYMKGRTKEGLLTASTFFEQAVARAPRYARAHSGLADTWAVLGFYDYVSPTQAFPKAEAAARRAIAIDPGLAQPYATLAYVEHYHHWNAARAESSYRRALELEPRYAMGHQWYANLLTATGRFEEATREVRLAQEADPRSLIAKAVMGWVRYYAGDHAGAVRALREAMALSPDHPLAYLWTGWALQELGAHASAVESHRLAVAAADSSALFVASLARSLALAGARGEAEGLLAGLEARGAGGTYVPAYEIAKVHEALGRADRALEWLERARRDRAHSIVFLRVDPQLRRLRSDPRFVQLLARVDADAGASR